MRAEPLVVLAAAVLVAPVAVQPLVGQAADRPAPASALPAHPRADDAALEALASARAAPVPPAAGASAGDPGLHRERWQPWTGLLDTPPEQLPAHLARLQGLELPPERCPGEAAPGLEEALDRLGEALDRASRLAAGELDAETRRALAPLVACLAAHVAHVPDLDPGTVVADEGTRAAWLGAHRDLLGQLDALDRLTVPAGTHCVDAQCRIQLGGPGDDVYEEDALLVVDAGGNDTYRNNAGGAGPYWTWRPVAALLDQGAGDDVYDPARTDTYGPPTIGSGYLGGVGTLVDEGGDDRFRALGTTMGSGFLGAGILVSGGGDDTFASPHPSAYETVKRPGQSQKLVAAAGAYGGYGVLVNRAGNDTYLQHGVDSLGWGGAGGLGLLVDRAGADRYRAEEAPTGETEANRTGISIGLGEVGGHGILLEGGGDDAYACEGTVRYGCIGSAYKGTLGLVYDRAGDDRYRVGPPAGTNLWSATGLGAAGVTGTGVLADARGHDAYASDSPRSGGYGAGGLGLMADLAGQDAYDFVHEPLIGQRGDGSLWGGDEAYPTYGATGLGVDRPG